MHNICLAKVATRFKCPTKATRPGCAAKNISVVVFYILYNRFDLANYFRWHPRVKRSSVAPLYVIKTTQVHRLYHGQLPEPLAQFYGRPEFEEITLVLRGMLRVDYEDGQLDVCEGEMEAFRCITSSGDVRSHRSSGVKDFRCLSRGAWEIIPKP